jgi:hypothetical protein
VAGNSFVFGAYTHCSWPAAEGTVADPTGKSFLFSLVNASGSAVCFSLRDRDRAIRLGGSVSFGAEKYEDGKATAFSNIMLMWQGAADQKDANAANPWAADKAYQPKDGAPYSQTFLAGQRYFTAAEIEVFQL